MDTVLIGYYDYLGTRPKNSHRQIIVTGRQSLEKILSQIQKIQKSQSPVKGIKILDPQSI